MGNILTSFKAGCLNERRLPISGRAAILRQVSSSARKNCAAAFGLSLPIKMAIAKASERALGRKNNLNFPIK